MSMLCFKPGHQGINSPGFCRLCVLHCQGCFALWATAPGQSSPDRLVALPLQATNSLSCKGGLLAGSFASHWDRRPIAEGTRVTIFLGVRGSKSQTHYHPDANGVGNVARRVSVTDHTIPPSPDAVGSSSVHARPPSRRVVLALNLGCFKIIRATGSQFWSQCRIKRMRRGVWNHKQSLQVPTLSMKRVCVARAPFLLDELEGDLTRVG